MATRLIHKRPGPLGCENALERYATTELIDRAGKRRLWVSPELRLMPTVKRISPYQEIFLETLSKDFTASITSFSGST
jgi:hypothetical protein